MKIRVLIADDHEVVRRGLGLMLRDSDIEVVAEAGTCEEAIDLALRHKPEVALLDVRMGDADGLDAVEALRSKLPQLRVVVLSTYDNPTYLARAAALGVADYLLKGAARAEIMGAIERAAKREPTGEQSLLRRVKQTLALRRTLEGTGSQLTDREAQVLRHIATGLSNRHIAMALGISIETVKEHVQNILRKLACSDRTAAAVWALRNGLA